MSDDPGASMFLIGKCRAGALFGLMVETFRPNL